MRHFTKTSVIPCTRRARPAYILNFIHLANCLGHFAVIPRNGYSMNGLNASAITRRTRLGAPLNAHWHSFARAQVVNRAKTRRETVMPIKCARYPRTSLCARRGEGRRWSGSAGDYHLQLIYANQTLCARSMDAHIELKLYVLLFLFAWTVLKLTDLKLGTITRFVLAEYRGASSTYLNMHVSSSWIGSLYRFGPPNL